MQKIANCLKVSAAALIAVANVAHAAMVDEPVPESAYITMNGLDWAWANPLPASSGLDLSYQSAHGWRIPTAAELANAPDAADFLKPTGNVPFNGTDLVSGAFFAEIDAAYTAAASAGACAAPYFSVSYFHCDWDNGHGQLYGPWAGLPGAESFAEQLVVRVSSVTPVAEPTPVPLWSPLGLLMTGLGVTLLGLRANRRQQNS